MSLTGAAGAHAAPASQAANPQQVIGLVNALRAEYGLPAYTVDQALMAAAQAHSDYQASIGQITHYGPGGERPRNRVAAAGYAAPGSFFVHENIYGGTQAGPAQAVTWWRNSPLHFQGMTSTRYVDVGAGIAYDANGLAYFTILFAHRVGQAGATVVDPPVSGGAQPAQPAPLPFTPVEVSTPSPDGAVRHVVQPGQAFLNISEAYGIDLYDMLALNGFGPDHIIHPGDELLIAPPYTPTPSPTFDPDAEDTAVAPLGDAALQATAAASTATPPAPGGSNPSPAAPTTTAFLTAPPGATPAPASGSPASTADPRATATRSAFTSDNAVAAINAATVQATGPKFGIDSLRQGRRAETRSLRSILSTGISIVAVLGALLIIGGVVALRLRGDLPDFLQWVPFRPGDDSPPDDD